MHDIWKGFTEFIRKGAVFLSAFCLAFISCFGVSSVALTAEEAESSNKSKIQWVANDPVVMSKWTSSDYSFVRFRYSDSSSVNKIVTPATINVSPNTCYAVNYRIGNGNTWYTLFYIFSETSPSTQIYYDTSPDSFNWTMRTNVGSSWSSYTYTGVDSGGNSVTGSKVYYKNLSQGSTTPTLALGTYMPDDCPRIQLESNQSVNTLLSVFSLDDYSYLPWNFSTSSGGMHFSDGTELDPTPTSQYSQVFIVMDSNHDNTISEAETYYYNATYNTTYDYSAINSDTDFNQMEFLYWVATEINNGNDNPGGGSGEPGGSGGGAGAIEGGITVTDSFTQSQTQSIAENAVNVQINNDNGVNQNNYQFLNNLINNSNGGEEGENPFSEAIGNVNKFVGIGRAFAVLVGVVFGWLPWWVTDLVSMMFSMLFVFVIFRLVHVFK